MDDVDTITVPCAACDEPRLVTLGKVVEPCPHCGAIPPCSFCLYSTAVTYFGEPDDPWCLCDVCFRMPDGDEHEEPDVRATIAYCTNLILDAIRKGAADDTH